MTATIAFYVSGHGFGHATRAAEVLKAIAAKQRHWRFYIRTAAPTPFFVQAGVNVRVDHVAIDTAVIEKDALHIDPLRTLDAARTFLNRKQRIIDAELDFIRANNIELLVGDIPFIVGDLSESAGIPSTAIGNFTWDWIYQPIASQHTKLLHKIRESYRKIPLCLMLPFNDQDAFKSLFREVRKTSLIARKSTRDPRETLRKLGIAKHDDRHLVLLATRGITHTSALRNAARDVPDTIFFTTEQIAGIENVVTLTLSNELQFVDILAACSTVISKLGYGIVADCIANNTALLFPPRHGFREDETLLREVPLYLKTEPIAASEYETGRWGKALNNLRCASRAIAPVSITGAEECATHIIDQA